MEPIVEFNAISKRYHAQGEPALDRLTLAIPRGSFFGLLGPNGAGKSTLLAILCGILEPNEGKVEMQVEGARLTPRTARRYIGYVPQDFAFYPTLTVRENLAFFGAVHGLQGRQLDDRINACVDLALLGPQRHKRAATLSGGLKRRLNLAIACLHSPLLLVLDEPTVGMDAQSRLHVQRELRALRSAGTTILYSSHQLEEVEGLCDERAIIDQGRIVSTGHTATLLGEPIVELRTESPLPAPLVARLASITRARDLKHADCTIVISCAEPDAALVRALDMLHLESIKVREARLGGRSLETLFFQLTGTRLRDGDDDGSADRLR